MSSSNPPHTVLHFYAPKEFSSGVAADGATPWNHRFAIHLQGLSKAHHPARIKLLPATNGPAHECFIDPAGLCQLPNSVRGLYVLAVVSGSNVLYLEPISIQGNTAQHEITLTLPRNAPPIRVLP